MAGAVKKVDVKSKIRGAWITLLKYISIRLVLVRDKSDQFFKKNFGSKFNQMSSYSIAIRFKKYLGHQTQLTYQTTNYDPHLRLFEK